MINVDIFNPKTVLHFIETASDAQLTEFLDRCSEVLTDSRFSNRGYGHLCVRRARQLAEDELVIRRFQAKAAS